MGFLAGCTHIHTFTCVCHLSKQSTMHKPTSHFAQKYSVLPLLFFIAHTQQWRCFPFEGQCWECFTSRWLIWDADGLSLSRDTPLEVTFCSWDSVIKLRMRTSLNVLCVILPPHVLLSRTALRMAISVRGKNSFLVHFHIHLVECCIKFWKT